MPYKNKEQRKEYDGKYYIKNKKKILERKKTQYAANREEMRGRRRKRRAEKPWDMHFEAAKQRCTDPNCIGFKYYGGKGIEFKLTMGEVEYLYKRDNAKDMECATIDRIYNDGNYVFGNCRFIEKSENSRFSAIGRWERERAAVQ